MKPCIFRKVVTIEPEAGGFWYKLSCGHRMFRVYNISRLAGERLEFARTGDLWKNCRQCQEEK